MPRPRIHKDRVLTSSERAARSLDERGVRRVGLPGELVELLDEIVEHGGYPNRVAALEPMIHREHERIGRERKRR